MAKKVIQVPVDEELLKGLDNLSRKQRKARAELIRQACLGYLRQVEHEEMDRLYQQGYEKPHSQVQTDRANYGIVCREDDCSIEGNYLRS